MEAKISPLPWNLNENVPDCINDAKGDFFLTATCARNGEDEANAAFIVRACNSHDALVAALRTLVERIEFYSAMREDERPNIEQWEYTEGSGDIAKARAALAAAEAP